MRRPTENGLKGFLWNYLCCIDNNKLSYCVYPITDRPAISICEVYQINVTCGEKSSTKEE